MSKGTSMKIEERDCIPFSGKKKHLKSHVHSWSDSTYQNLVAVNIDFLFLVLKCTEVQATITKTATSGKSNINLIFQVITQLVSLTAECGRIIKRNFAI